LPIPSYSWPTSITHGVTTGEINDTLAAYDRVGRLIAARNQGALIVASADQPAEIKDAATVVCDGTGDQTEINAQIDASATAGYGQPVGLIGGGFNINGAIKFRRSVPLAGSRYINTRITATGTWTSVQGVITGAMLEPFDDHQDRCDVRRMMLFGNRFGGANVQGLYYHVEATTGFIYGTDTRSLFEDLFFYETKQTAARFSGANCRFLFANRLHAKSCGAFGTDTAHGFHLGCADSHFVQCDAGDCSGNGFFIQSGANNRLTTCKAWFSDLAGFRLQGAVRCQINGCESQDNREHGYYIDTGTHTLQGCHADSNGWDQVVGGGVSAFDGFHCPDGANVNALQMVGCEAYDKNENARGIHQRYGFYLGSGMFASQVIGVATSNGTGMVGGTGINGAAMNVQVSGKMSDGTPTQVFRAVGSALGAEVTFWRSEATAAVANQGLDLPQALTELDSGVQGTRKLVEVLDIGSQVQLAVTVRGLQATADSLTISIRDVANTANVLATVTMSISAAIETQTAKSVYAAKPSWFTADTTLGVYTSHTGAATLDYIFKDVTLRHRP
jgi:hypothetical protein